MTENPNVAALRRAYDEWDRSKGGNLQVWLDLVADEVELFSICDGRAGVEFSARCTGRADIVRYLTGLTEGWQMQQCRMDEFIADGDRVVALGRHVWTNRATGRALDTAKCDIWRFRHGRVVDFAEFYDSHAMMVATGAA